MYIKCVFEDGTEQFKKLEDHDLYKILDKNKIVEYLSDKYGEIEDWEFDDNSGNSENHTDIDIRDFLLANLNVTLDEKNVKNIEFLEDDSYEKIVAHMTGEDEGYNKKILVTLKEEAEGYEFDDPYSDEPPDYD